MKENTQEKSLIKINKNSIFYNIKNFFQNIFHKKEISDNASNLAESSKIISENNKNQNRFEDSIRIIEDEETKLLKLQRQYRKGEIKGEELSEKQIKSLGELYDKQIANLRKSNEIRKQKLLEYRRKLQTDNKK